MAKWPDKIDIGIISLLRKDGRMPNTEIADHLGVSEGSVRRRIHRMLNKGLVRATALVNPEAVGYDVYAIITVQCEPKKGKEVATRISELPEVRRVSLLAGEYDIMVQAYFKSNRDLADFLTNRVATVDGVTKTKTFIILNQVKRASEWEIPTPSR